MAIACKTLDEAQTCERTATLAWENKKTTAHHLEQQLTAAQGITIPKMTTMIAPSTLGPTLPPPSPHTCTRRLPTSRIYDWWS
jgi:hypothetical protein